MAEFGAPGPRHRPRMESRPTKSRCLHGVRSDCERCRDEQETADAQATDEDWFDES